MKRMLLAAIAAFGFGSTAVAADLPARMPVKAPPIVAPAFSWSGCYIGGYVGGAVDTRSVDTIDPVSQGGAFAAGTFYNVPSANATNGGLHRYDLGAGVIGGGTLGCNYQPVGSPFVLGLEGEAGYMSLSRTVIDPYSIAFGSDTRDFTRIGDWYAVVAGRAGYAVDRVLLYAKGGVGFTDLNSTVIDACNTGACGTGLLNATFSDTQAFWVGGGGIEWALDQNWQNWSVKAEYLFLGLNKSYGVCGPGAAAAAGSIWCSVHNVEGVHTVKVGLNYRFNWAAPVVAKY